MGHFSDEIYFPDVKKPTPIAFTDEQEATEAALHALTPWLEASGLYGYKTYILGCLSVSKRTDADIAESIARELTYAGNDDFLPRATSAYIHFCLLRIIRNNTPHENFQTVLTNDLALYLKHYTQKKECNMKNILNLTQHTATQDQIDAGVKPEPLASVKQLLNFDTLPSRDELIHRAEEIAQLAHVHFEHEYENEVDLDAIIDLQQQRYALIGGAPFFMSHLEAELRMQNILPLYAFSVRESVEVHNPDGSVSKQNVFKHLGFVQGS